MKSYSRLAAYFLLSLFFLGCGSGSDTGGVSNVQFSDGSSLAGIPGPTSPVQAGTGVPVEFGGGGLDETPVDPETPPNPDDPVTLESIIVSPTNLALDPGQSSIIAVEGRLSDGTVVALPGTTSATVVYQSNNTNIAVVNATGTVVAQTPGNTEVVVTVTSGGETFSQTVSVVVNQVQSSFTAFVYIADPSSTDPTAGSIDYSGVTSNTDQVQPRPIGEIVTPRNLDVAASSNGNLLFNLEVPNDVISTFSLNRITGVPTATGFSLPVSEPDPVRIALHPNGEFVYVVHSGGVVTSYTTTPAGQLSNNAASPPIATELGDSMPIFNATGDVMYKVNPESDSVTIFQVDLVTGELSYLNSETPHFQVAVGDGPSAALLSRDGAFLYVSNADSASISIYNVGPTGDLTLAASTSASANINSLFLYPNTTIPALYALSDDGVISGFTTNVDGTLTPINSTRGPGQFDGFSLLIDPTGLFAFSFDSEGFAYYFVIDAGGVLQGRGGAQSIFIDAPVDAVIVPAL